MQRQVAGICKVQVQSQRGQIPLECRPGTPPLTAEGKVELILCKAWRARQDDHTRYNNGYTVMGRK